MSATSLGESIAGMDNLYAWGENQLVKLYLRQNSRLHCLTYLYPRSIRTRSLD